MRSPRDLYKTFSKELHQSNGFYISSATGERLIDAIKSLWQSGQKETLFRLLSRLVYDDSLSKDGRVTAAMLIGLYAKRGQSPHEQIIAKARDALTHALGLRPSLHDRILLLSRMAAVLHSTEPDASLAAAKASLRLLLKGLYSARRRQSQAKQLRFTRGFPYYALSVLRTNATSSLVTRRLITCVERELYLAGEHLTPGGPERIRLYQLLSGINQPKKGREKGPGTES